MLDLFTLLVFCCVLVTFYAVRANSRSQRRRLAVEQRLSELRREVLPDGTAAQALLAQDDSIALELESDWPRWWPALARQLSQLRNGLKVLGWLPALRMRITFSALAAVVGALLLARMTGTPLTLALVTAPVIWLIGCTALYQSAMSALLAELSRALPEAIDAITRICRAGVPLHSAFSIAADHQQGALEAELRDIDHWLKLGVPIKQVMQNSAARVPLPEYRFFAVILIISQESGGRLGDTLERLTATLRARSELQMKVQAKTSEARASAKIVALLVPGVLLYMYLNAPEDFRFMFNDPAGIKVSIYAACSVGLGLLITHLMVRRVR